MKYKIIFNMIVFYALNIYTIKAQSNDDGFSLEDVNQEQIQISQQQSNDYKYDITKHLNADFGVLSSITPFGDLKNSVLVNLSYNENWKDFYFFIQGTYSASLYEVGLTPQDETLGLPDATLTQKYSLLEVGEFKIKYNVSEKFLVSIGREKLAWGQQEGLSVIGVFLLPITDNFITFTPNKTDFLYPQDILTATYFFDNQNELNFYYFVNNRLSPIFDSFYGEILNDAPPVFALRYTRYNKQSLFALTYFNGINFLGGIDNNVSVEQIGDNTFNLNSSNKNPNILDEDEDEEGGPPSSVTQAVHYAKSQALAFEYSYNINSKWTFNAELVGDITQKSFIVPIKQDAYIPDNQEDADYLTYLAKNGTLYNTTTILNNMELVYQGQKWTTFVSLLTFVQTTNLFSNSKENNKYASYIFDTKYGIESITALPLFNTQYFFDAEKNKTLGYFLGSQGALFGTGLYFKNNYNQYISYGVVAGKYIGVSDLLDLVRIYLDTPEGYELNSGGGDSTIQASIFVRVKI